MININKILLGVFLLTFLSLSFVSAISVTINENQQIGNIREDFYGVSHITDSNLGNSTDNDIGTGTNASLSDRSNASWHIEKLMDSKIKHLRIVSSLDVLYPTNTSLTATASSLRALEDKRRVVEYAWNNGTKVTIVLSSLPNWLANNSYPCTTSNATCPPNNYTAYGVIVDDLINRITNNKAYISIIELEYRNEPYGSQYLADLSADNITKASTYITDFNNIYSTLKALLPTTPIGTGAVIEEYPNMYNGILKNITTNDFFTYHSYKTSYITSSFEGVIDRILANCTTANCTRISFTEWQVDNSTLQNTSSLNNNYRTELSLVYIDALRKMPNAISLMLYQWSEEWSYANTAKYPQYPKLWSMVSEPKLDNAIYSPYNITKTFATNHKAGNTVLNSSSSDSQIKVVVSNDSTKQYITLTNTNASTKSAITIAGIKSGVASLRDNNTGEYYAVSGNMAYIPNLDGYEVQTLQSTSTTPLSVSFVSPTPANGSTVNTRNVTINATIHSENPLSSIIWNWNGTNYSLYDDSLVLFYNFDNRSALGENDTKVVDLSRYGNNGTVVGGANITWSNTGKYGGSFNWNTSSAYISSADSDSLDIANGTGGGLTISLWYNANSLPQGAGETTYLIRKGSEYRIYYAKNEGRFWFLTNNAGVDTSTSSGSPIPTTDGWHHLILTWNLTNLQWYQDGVQSTSISFSKAPVKGTGTINIGAYSSTTGFWNGSIDDLLIYNKSISSNDALQIYNSQITKYNSTNYIFSTNQNTSINSINYNLCTTDSTANTLCENSRSMRFLVNSYNLFNNQIGRIKDLFYGVSYNNNKGLSSYDNVSNDMDCTLESQSDYTSERTAFLDSNMKVLRINAYIENMVNSSYAVKTGSAVDSNRDTIRWALNNNISVLLIANYMPDFLANTSSYCSSSTRCPANNDNYTAYGNALVVWINNVTSGIGTDNLNIEIWNEPEQGGWLNNLSTDNITKATEYVKLFNGTRNVIKANYPNMKVYGPVIGGSDMNTSANTNMLNTFLSNLTNNFDGISFHNYIANDEIFTSEARVATDTLLEVCALYGADCSDILITEWNMGSGSYSFTPRHGPAYAENYIGILNKYPSNVSMYTFEWSTPYKNLSCDGYSGNYIMYQQHYENKTISYNITNDFTRYAPAGGTVYNSTSDYSPIKVVSTKIGTTDNIIITNADTDSVNITLNTDNLNTDLLIDVESGVLYDVSSGTTSLGVMDAYDVKYLSTPYFVQNDAEDWVVENYLGEEIRDMTRDEIETYGDGIESCTDPTNRTIYNFVMIMSALAIVIFTFAYGFRGGVMEIDMGRLIVMFVGVIVGVILWQMAGVNLGSAC